MKSQPRIECREVRDRIAGDHRLDEAMLSHLESCASCGEAWSGPAAPDPARLHLAAPTVEILPEELRNSTEASIALEDRGWVGRFRALPTFWRRASFFFMAAVAVALAARSHRPDLSGFMAALVLIEVLALSAMVVALGWMGFSPVHVPRPKHLGWRRVLVAAGWILPALFLPIIGALVGTAPEAVSWARHATCFAYGAMLSIPALATFFLCDRGGRSGGIERVAPWIACALVGVAGLQLHCGVDHPAHVLWAHATLPAAVGGIGLATQWLRPERSHHK